MSDVRCRACDAAVPDQAQWCSLCFTDLRTPPPAAVREPVSVPAAVAVSASEAPAAAAATTETLTAEAPTAETEPTGPQPFVAAAPVTPPRPTDSASWPCPRCHAWVPITLDACTECGAGFLAGASGAVATHLPIVGDMGKLTQAQRLLVGVAISIVLIVGFVLLAEIGGHLF